MESRGLVHGASTLSTEAKRRGVEVDDVRVTSGRPPSPFTPRPPFKQKIGLDPERKDAFRLIPQARRALTGVWVCGCGGCLL